jgi:hypothetical protein
MVSDLTSALLEVPDLLYVTSAKAIGELLPGTDLQQLLDDLGERMFELPDPDPSIDIETNTADLRSYLIDHSSWIKGVVIIGDYTQVSSRIVKCLDPVLLDLVSRVEPESREAAKPGNKNSDPDEWWVWNDDIYGSKDDVTFLSHFPVSRIPIIPENFGVPYTPTESESVFGIRGSEFSFADVVHQEVLHGSGGIKQSPPIAIVPPTGTPPPMTTEQVSDVDLAVDWLYLVLHHPNAATLRLTGTAVIFTDAADPEENVYWFPIAMNHTIFNGSSPAPAVVFGGICWGAMLVDQMASAHFDFPGASFEAFDVDRSVPVAYINKGTNAFIGFTTQHHVPVDSGSDTDISTLDKLTLGAPLHRYFWENIVAGVTPAEALFLAKASVIGSLDPETMAPLALAQSLKAVWSATCIGLGW